MFGGFSIMSGFICLFVLKETKGLTDKELAELYTSKKNDEDNKEEDPASNSYLLNNPSEQEN